MRCDVCQKEFSGRKTLNKHIKTVHAVKNFKCDLCEYRTNDSYNFQRHNESCDKRKRKQVVIDQDAKRAKEEEPSVYSCNQGPNEDEASDENHSCFQGSLHSKTWTHQGTQDLLMVMEK